MNIQEQNKKLAEEVMGWKYRLNWGYKRPGKTDYLFSYDWQPHTNLTQALDCADRLCEVNGWKWKSSNGSRLPSTKYVFEFWIEEKPFEALPIGRGGTLPQAVYSALISALEKGEPE